MGLLRLGKLSPEMVVTHISGRSQWFLCFGVLAVVSGALALMAQVTSTLFTVYLLAFLLTIVGASEIVLGGSIYPWPRAVLWGISGALYMFVGLFSLANPLFASEIFTLIIGAALFAAGLARIFLGFSLPVGPRPYVILAGTLSTILGLFIIIGWPSDSSVILGILFGVDLMFYGSSWIGMGLLLRKKTRNTTPAHPQKS